MVSLNAQIHTAEHLFWALLKKIYPDMKTEAMEFKPDKLRLDYRYSGKTDPEKIKELEKNVNETIRKNLPVEIKTVPQKKAAKITDLSLLPKNVKEVRLVKVGDISTEACAGNHVKNTSEIGNFKILEVKKKGKDKLRIYITVEEKMETKKKSSYAKAFIKPQTLKGFRDFLPEDMAIRQKVINLCKEVFESYGFEPLETPTIEYAETLLGKYGEEADKLVYLFRDRGGRRVGLRYDLTVPLARVIAQHPNIPLPFKRYQMQLAYRAEKPQKGRYREFWQCDVDTVGIASPLADAEIIALIYSLFKKLGFREFVTKINSRQVLFSFMEKVGVPKEKVFPALQSIDKLDKKSKEEVQRELKQKGLKKETIKEIFKALPKLKPNKELEKLFGYLKSFGVPDDYWRFEPTLVRGLDYYTGAAYETWVTKPKIGSLTGGGRWDELIGMFTGKNVPATGTTIGIERIIDVIRELKLWPEVSPTPTKVLVTIFSPELLEKSIEIAIQLRNKKINAEIYLDPKAKLDKQLKYANRKGIPYAVIIGPEEAKNKTVTIKDMKTGKQKTVPQKELSQQFN